MEKSALEKRTKIEPHLKYCQAKEIIPAKIIECNVENSTCNYFFNFRDSKFCKHPLNFEIAKRTSEEKL